MEPIVTQIPQRTTPTFWMFIDHQEKRGTYDGVVIEFQDKQYRFISGNPVADYRAAIEKIQAMVNEIHAEHPEITSIPVMQSSSLGHFVYDEPGFRFDENDVLIRDPRDGTRYVRVKRYDKRIPRGDDYNGDAWFDLDEDKLHWVVVGHNPNKKVKS